MSTEKNQPQIWTGICLQTSDKSKQFLQVEKSDILCYTIVLSNNRKGNELDYKNGYSYKSTPYGESLLFIIETTLILLLLLFKLVFFYEYIGIGRFSPVMCAATVFMVMSSYFIILRFTKLDPAGFLKILYTVICIFLFIDRVYFSYLNKLPSFTAAKMSYQLPDIADMLLQLVTVNHALYILDLPILLIYHNNYKKRTYFKLTFRDASDKLIKWAKSSALLVIAVCLMFIGITLMDDNFAFSYLQNEIITYHTSDAVKVLFRQSNAENVDVSQYIPAFVQGVPKYYGIGSGRNIITIQVEALQSFVIGFRYNGQEITPNLNALIAGESLYFSNYYYQVGGGNTSDVEFTVNNSLYAPENDAAYMKYENNDFFGLPLLLKEKSYSGAYAFHGYKGEFWNREKAYPKQGFDDYISEEDLNITEKFNMGISDKQFFSQSIEYLKGYKQPFYAFMITLSSHHPYIIPKEYRELVLQPEDEGTLVGDYLQSIRYLDSALGIFLDDLKECGLYNNSVISIYGDHYAISSGDAPSYRVMSRLLNHNYYEEDIFKVPFIIHVPGSGINETIETIGGHIDNLPTILHILGIENIKSIMFGQNLISAETGIVYQQTHMARGSFISDDVILYYPDNGIMINAAAINRKTGERMGVDGYNKIIADAKKVYTDCDALLEANKVLINQTDIYSENSNTRPLS